jgi:hypothetical protein
MVAVRVYPRGTGSPHLSTSHARVMMGPLGWLIGERSSSSGEQEEEKGDSSSIRYYYSNLPAADASLERLAQLWRTAAGPSSSSTRTPRASAVRRLPGEEVGRAAPAPGALDARLQLSHTALKYCLWRAFGGLFPPAAQRHTTLPAIHRQILMWLLQDLVVWFIETDRIKTFHPRRN